MGFYRPFKKVEECDEYLGHSVEVSGKPAVFKCATMDKRKVLGLEFELEDGSRLNYNSLSAFYCVTAHGHPFGMEDD